MLDPRIYRTGCAAVAVAVVVLAFSLRDQQGPLSTGLPPDALNGQNIYNTANRLASEYPNRRPGSAGDDALAGYVAQQFGRYGFAVSTVASSARTADGTRTVETVTATRPGLGGGSIVVLAHRDALSSPATAELTGTATLLELARVLAGETHHRTIVLASTSASAGDAGAAALARSLGGIDAVIALGDMGGARLHNPLVVPWSEGQDVAPTSLRNTVASALQAQAATPPGGTSLGGQLVHLAFPLTLTEQGPFGKRGVPALLISSSGERRAANGEPLSADRATALGRTVLQTINALDGGPGIPAASPYLLYSGKLVPAWAISVLVLGLMLPVLIATVDGVARARRRGHRVLRWILWTLTMAAPFALGIGLIIVARLIGWIGAAPPGPVGAGEIQVGGSGVALLVTLVLLSVLFGLGIRWLWPRMMPASGRPGDAVRKRQRSDGEPVEAGRGPAALLVLCAVEIAIWLANPFAALLLIPALHLWMWALQSEVRFSPVISWVLLVVGLVPPLLAIAYYALVLGLSPVHVIWNGVLLVAGGQLSVVTALEWAVVLGCLASGLVIVRYRTAEERFEAEGVTIRGPVTYAGPGSLGGTESALRARR